MERPQILGPVERVTRSRLILLGAVLGSTAGAAGVLSFVQSRAFAEALALVWVLVGLLLLAIGAVVVSLWSTPTPRDYQVSMLTILPESGDSVLADRYRHRDERARFALATFLLGLGLVGLALLLLIAYLSAILGVGLLLGFLLWMDRRGRARPAYGSRGLRETWRIPRTSRSPFRNSRGRK